MNTKNLLTFQAVVAILFGLALIFIPKTLLDPYLNDTNELNMVGQFLGAMYGAALMGIGCGSWMARNEKNPKSWLYGIMVANALNLYIYFKGTLSGHFNSLIWSSIVLVGIIAMWAAYLLFIKKSD